MRKSDYFRGQLCALQASYPTLIAEVRGLGLMLGLQIGSGGAPLGAVAKRIQKELYENHAIIIECGGRGGSVLRFLTSLDITIDEIDVVVASLRTVLAGLSYGS